MIWATHVAGIVCTTYMKSGLPQRNKLLTDVGNNIVKAKIVQLFGVGNANSFGFTASWLETKDGEDVMRIETKDNSYLL